MSEHTPGPWRDDDGTIVAGEGPINIAYTRTVIAEREAEQRANARLIAAAPDLLAACEAAYAWLGRFGVHAPTAFGGEAELAEQLRAAIANAKREP